MTRSKYVVQRRGNSNSREGYFRQYYQRNKDKQAEYRSAKFASRAGEKRQPSGEYENRLGEWSEDFNGQDDLRKIMDIGANETVINSNHRDCSVKGIGRREVLAEYRRRNQEWINECRTVNAPSRAAYARQHSLQNKDKNAEYRNDSIRNYSIPKNERKLRYQGEYIFRNKEKVAEYRQGYSGGDRNLETENRRVSKREYLRMYFGSQRTMRSWKSPEMVREYLDSVASRLNILNHADWYRVSRRQMAQYEGLSLYEKFRTLGAALQFAYPEINWDQSLFSHRGKKSGQRWLKLKIEELLPGIDIIEDFQHPDLHWVVDSEYNMELDLWIPLHRIGIEFQGQQHYFNVDKLGPSSAAGAYSDRDTLKNSLCESRGITLIVIPYWWDGFLESLSATLYQARPDVFPVSHSRPIPCKMPVLSRGNSGRQLPDSDELKNIE